MFIYKCLLRLLNMYVSIYFIMNTVSIIIIIIIIIIFIICITIQILVSRSRTTGVYLANVGYCLPVTTLVVEGTPVTTDGVHWYTIVDDRETRIFFLRGVSAYPAPSPLRITEYATGVQKWYKSRIVYAIVKCRGTEYFFVYNNLGGKKKTKNNY